MHNWDDIRYFLSVARCGSYSSAAKLMKVNHTTVSRRIRVLEQELAVKLFINTTQGLEMTNAAQAVFEKATELEHTHNYISRTLAEYNDQLSGQIKLTMPQDIFTNYLADDLAAFKTHYPAIELIVSLSNNLSDIAAKEADIAVRISQQPPGDLIGSKIATLKGAVYGPKNIDTTKPVGIILWEDDYTLPQWALDNFDRCYCSLRVNSLNAMYDAMESGFGIAAMPSYLPDMMIENSKHCEIEKLDINIANTSWSIWVLTHVEVRQSARIKILKDHITQSLNRVKNCF